MANTVRKLLVARENLLATFNLTLEVWAELVAINNVLFVLTGKKW
jgi:hypothetical protein